MERLHDIVLSEPVSWLPQTTAWYVAVVAALLVMALGLAAWLRHRRKNRYRREALARLAEIANRGAYAELPALVKRTALCCGRRVEVASLTGEAWLRFLDESYGGRGFTHGPGRALTTLAYAPTPELDGDAIVPVVRDWIRKHDVRV